MKNFYEYPGKTEAQASIKEMRTIHQWGRKRTVAEALESKDGYSAFVIGWVKSLAMERTNYSANWQDEAIKIYAEMGIEAEVKWNEVYPK